MPSPYPSSSRWTCLALRAGCCIAAALAAFAPPAAAQGAAAPGRAASSAGAAAAAPAPRFAVFEYEIEGNTVLSVDAVERAVLSYMGEDRQIADVEAARAALEKAYQQAGFLTAFVDVPEQRVDAGIVTLHVTEGRVERLRISGSRYYDQGFIRERIPALAEGQVPDFNAVQRQIAAVSRDERRLQPVLKPGLEPGTVQAEIKVDDRLPLTATLEVNNRHAADTKSLRLQASIRYDNLFQRDHGIALTAITAPQAPSQSKVFVGNYTVPFGERDTLLGSVTASDSEVEPLGAATVLGKGTTWGLRWLHSVAFADSSHQFAFGADYKNLKESIVSADDASGTVDTPLHYLPFQASHSGTWFGEHSQVTLNSSFVFAVRSLLRRAVDCPGNVGKVDQFACKRQGADGGFSYVRTDLRYTGALAEWAGGLPGQIALRFGGQLATQPLVSAEQYALGGAENVRGYLEAEASGDHALLGSVEWRSPNLFGSRAPEAALPWWNELSLLGFVDAARAYVTEPLAGQAGRLSLLGTGVGLRLRMRQQLSADADLGWPLKATSATPDKSARLHVRLSAQF